MNRFVSIAISFRLGSDPYYVPVHIFEEASAAKGPMLKCLLNILIGLLLAATYVGAEFVDIDSLEELVITLTRIMCRCASSRVCMN